MKAVIQRVTRASVTVDGLAVGKIDAGLVVLAGVANGDTAEDVDYVAQKILGLRILDDTEGKMNLSVTDKQQELLVVSQFTLLALTRKGRRPGFKEAAPPVPAEAFFNALVGKLKASGLSVATGKYQAHMLVEIHNDGPVTIIIDSRERLLSRD